MWVFCFDCNLTRMCENLLARAQSPANNQPNVRELLRTRRERGPLARVNGDAGWRTYSWPSRQDEAKFCKLAIDPLGRKLFPKVLRGRTRA